MITTLLLVTAWTAQQQEPLSMDFDIRNRIVLRDEYPVFRSLVNLGNGPRVFGANARYEGGKDSLDIHASSLGDPNSEARIEMKRRAVYQAVLRYRTLAYFNNLPSFANPLLEQGVAASQRMVSLDNKQFDFDLRFRPGTNLTPFVSVLRTFGGGFGVSPFVGSGDEFAVPAEFHSSLTTVSGGAEWKRGNWFGVLEQGWTGYADRQSLRYSGTAQGNRPGDAIVLNELDERYSGSGSGLHSRATVQGAAAASLTFAGQAIYSRPRFDSEHSLNAQGAFRDPNLLRSYTNLIDQSFAGASQPRTSGSWNTLYRPLGGKRLRLRHTWFSDIYRISGTSTAALEVTQGLRQNLRLRYNQSDAEAASDFGNWLTLRAAHRYIRSEAELPPPDLLLEPSRTFFMRRHAVLAGMAATFWKSRAKAYVDYDRSPGGQTYFRTGLQDYQKLTLQLRVRVSNTLRIGAIRKDFANRNTGADIENRLTGANIEWTPRRYTLAGSYTREFLRSETTFTVPQDLQTAISRYDDRLHQFHAYGTAPLWRATIEAGGTFSNSDGSRPTKYYSPQASVVTPVNERLSVVAEWRWYRYQAIESFRAHTVSAGVRIAFKR